MLKYYDLWICIVRIWLRSTHVDVASGQNGRVEDETLIFSVKMQEMLTLVNPRWWEYDRSLHLCIFLYLNFFFPKKTQRMLASAARVYYKKKAQSNYRPRSACRVEATVVCRKLPGLKSLILVLAVASPSCVHGWEPSLLGAFHPGKQEDWTDCQLRSSLLVALTFSPLSVGELTVAGGAEKKECMGKSPHISINSIRVHGSDYYYIQFVLARPLGS